MRNEPSSNSETDTRESTKDGKTILFILRNSLYLRNFETPIRQIAGAGHHVVILLGARTESIAGVSSQIERMVNDLGDKISIKYISAPSGYRRHLNYELQSSLDILFYSGDHYENAVFARTRIVKKSTPIARFLFGRKLFKKPANAEKAKQLLNSLKNALPADQNILDQLRTINPDLVVISPLIDIRSDQSFWLKAAKSLGLKTVLAVASWDNLTNKSCIQEIPDKVLVWNEIQKDEAIKLHGILPQNVVITGAQLYDFWFETEPSQNYSQFCAQFGFDRKEALIVYTGSSQSIAGDESGIVGDWLGHLRNSDVPVLANANVLIRPHPLNQADLAATDFSPFGKVKVYPKQGGFPVTQSARAEYFDALYHCSAIVGINTSAILEAAILNKQSFTISTPQYHSTQQGTLHYHHLTKGGVLIESDTFEDQLRSLSKALIDKGKLSNHAQNFIEKFLRPHGWERPATPIFVDALVCEMNEQSPVRPVEIQPPKWPMKFLGTLLALVIAAPNLLYRLLIKR